MPSESGRYFRLASTVAGLFIGVFSVLLRAKYKWDIKTLIFTLIPVELVLIFAIMSGSGSFVLDAFNLSWFGGVNIFILLPWFLGMGVGSVFIKYKAKH